MSSNSHCARRRAARSHCWRRLAASEKQSPWIHGQRRVRPVCLGRAQRHWLGSARNQVGKARCQLLGRAEAQHWVAVRSLGKPFVEARQEEALARGGHDGPRTNIEQELAEGLAVERS